MTATTHSTTATDGARIDYTEHHRTGAGRPVVLLAGFGARATSQLHQVLALARTDHRVITADLPGHGAADWRDTARAVDVPVLFLAGAESELWPASHADASAALPPRPRRHDPGRRPRGEHGAARAFNRALLEFAQDLR